MIFYLIFEKINMPDWSITLMLGAQESYLKIQSIYLAASHTSLPFFIPSLFPKFWLFSEWKLYILVKRHNILMKMKKIKATKSYCAVSLSRLLLSQTPRVKRNTLLQPSQVPVERPIWPWWHQHCQVGRLNALGMTLPGCGLMRKVNWELLILNLASLELHQEHRTRPTQLLWIHAKREHCSRMLHKQAMVTFIGKV